jgi:hypothetical protein
LASTELPSSPLSNSLKLLIEKLLGSSLSIYSNPCLTRSTPFSPIEPLVRDMRQIGAIGSSQSGAGEGYSVCRATPEPQYNPF